MRYNLIYILFLFIGPNLKAQCIDDIHSPLPDRGWQSCSMSTSPIPSNGVHHWLQLDLSYAYTLDSLILWNHNVWGETGQGVKKLQIDYSVVDGTWMSYGEISLPEALGSWKYQGIPAIPLNGIQANKLLLTVLETHDQNSSCAGLGEIKIILGEYATSTEDWNEESVALYPNPASDFIHINPPSDYEIDLLTITNSVGHTIFQSSLQSGVDISHLPSGMYFVTLDGTEVKITKSFIKIRE